CRPRHWPISVSLKDPRRRSLLPSCRATPKMCSSWLLSSSSCPSLTSCPSQQPPRSGAPAPAWPLPGAGRRRHPRRHRRPTVAARRGRRARAVRGAGVAQVLLSDTDPSNYYFYLDRDPATARSPWLTSALTVGVLLTLCAGVATRYQLSHALKAAPPAPPSPPPGETPCPAAPPAR